MNWVWNHSKVKGSKRLVLLCLADNANDRGECWPSLATIARKCQLSRRYVINIAQELENEGAISKIKRLNQGEYTSSFYIIHAEVVNNTSLGSEAGDTTGSEQDITTGSEEEITRVVIPSSLKPSINHQLKPKQGTTNISGVSATADYYFGLFKRKRWSNPKQKEFFTQLEAEVGDKVLKQAIDWAAVNSISNLQSIATTARKIAKRGGRAADEVNIEGKGVHL